MSGYQNEAARQAEINKPKLIVKVLEARGIKAADFGGTSDPYVELRIKGQSTSVKTRTIKKTLNPMWNEELILYPTNPEYDVVDIRLYDFDASSNNDLLGELEFPVALAVGKPPKEDWKQVMNKKGPSTFTAGKGEIKLSFAYVDPSKPENNSVPSTTSTQAHPPSHTTPTTTPTPNAPQQYPPQQYPPQQYPPQQYPPQQYPPQQYPPQQYPPQQYPPQQYPPQQYPPQQYPPQQYPPQQYPPQQYPPQQYPPQQYPPQQYPPQQYPPQQYPPQQYPPQYPPGQYPGYYPPPA